MTLPDLRRIDGDIPADPDPDPTDALDNDEAGFNENHAVGVDERRYESWRDGWWGE